MIWGKTKEERDAEVASWKQWNEKFLWLPRKLEDTHEWAWLTRVWIRWQWCSGYDGAFWEAHHVKELPPLGPGVVHTNQSTALKATCIVCQENEWPMCGGCRKAILAFKAITE